MNTYRKTQSAHLWVLLIAASIAVAIWVFWLFYGAKWAHTQIESQISTSSKQSSKSASSPETNSAQILSELGQTGDAFGSINALLTALAGAIVFWAGYLQKEQLNQARSDAIDAAVEAERERISRQKQEFESLFFRLLDLSREITERIETPEASRPKRQPNAIEQQLATFGESPARSGSAALDHFAWRVDSGSWQTPVDEQSLLKSLVHRFKTKVYDSAPSAFGPYYRNLYQTFKHIAECDVLTEDERVRYSNIARGQISEGAVLLLALNGLTLIGNKFIPLIERFGLLEHMHPKYHDKYATALRIGYRHRAFLGRDERSKPGNEWQETSLLHPNKFGGLQTLQWDGEES